LGQHRRQRGLARRTAPILLEIFRNRFKAIAEEMGSIMLHTGFTVFVKETSNVDACFVALNGEEVIALLNIMLDLVAN
jgi:N-methylhydantoinase B